MSFNEVEKHITMCSTPFAIAHSDAPLRYAPVSKALGVRASRKTGSAI